MLRNHARGRGGLSSIIYDLRYGTMTWAGADHVRGNWSAGRFDGDRPHVCAAPRPMSLGGRSSTASRSGLLRKPRPMLRQAPHERFLSPDAVLSHSPLTLSPELAEGSKGELARGVQGFSQQPAQNDFGRDLHDELVLLRIPMGHVDGMDFSQLHRCRAAAQRERPRERPGRAMAWRAVSAERGHRQVARRQGAERRHRPRIDQRIVAVVELRPRVEQA